MDITGLGSLFDFGGKILDRVFPDPQTRDAAKLEMFKAQQAGAFKELDQEFELAKAQIAVNAVEAQSASVFTSGWRPFIGWICGSGLAYQFLIYPILVAFQPKIVQLDMGTLLTLLMGMLGLGAMRTAEKFKGVESK
jgi:hypothetical protein